MLNKKTAARKTVRVITFFFILLLILEGVSLIFSRLSSAEGRQGVHMRDYVYTQLGEERKDSLDLLVLGDSESAAGYSPMEVYLDRGITSFSASNYMMRVQEAYPLLKMALKKQKPRVVLLEALAMIVPTEKEEGRKLQLDSDLMNRIPVFRFHNIWRHALDDVNVQPYMYKGYIIRKGVRGSTEAQIRQYMKPDQEIREISPDNIRALEQMKKLCDSKGIRFILFACPSTRNYDMKIHNGIAKAAEKLGIPFLDLNLEADQIGIDWTTDTFDAGDHLNLLGARKVTGYLTGKILEMEPDLPDHRSDPAFQSWNEEAGRYQADAEAGLKKIRKKIRRQERSK